MAVEDEIARIKLQEAELVFERFDEGVAWALGSAIRERAEREGLALVCDIRLWDRTMFYCAMPGTTGDNPHWVRRKIYIVHRVNKSSLRAMLENKGERQYPAERGHDPRDYALAGGGFPIRIKDVGTIGAITISGLHERDDHRIAVEAICDYLGKDRAQYALLAQT